jgi:hypothetical protein
MKGFLVVILQGIKQGIMMHAHLGDGDSSADFDGVSSRFLKTL